MNLKQGHSYRWKNGAGRTARGVFVGLVEGNPDRAEMRVHVPAFDGYVPGATEQVPAAALVPIADLRVPSGAEPAVVRAAREVASAWLQGRTRAATGAVDANHPARRLPLTTRYADPESVGWLGVLEPGEGERSWVAFVAPDGFTLLWGTRAADGAVVGDPVAFLRDPKTLEQKRGRRDDNDDETAYRVTTRYDVAIHIDRPKGTERVGVDENGVPWRTVMTCDYGFFPSTMGGDHLPIDCYVGDRTDCKDVHIVEQLHADGTDDEQKVMLCHGTAEDALRVYQAHVPARFFGRMWSLPVREWKRQLRAAQADPMMPFRFTHDAVGPNGEEPPPSTDRSGGLGATRIAPPVAPAVIVKPATPRVGIEALVRLAEEPIALPAGELFFTRAATVRAEGIDEKKRMVPFVMSTETRDSYGTILRAKWDLSRFQQNPVLLWMHNRRADLPPVGTMGQVRVENRELLGNAYFDDACDFDTLVWKKYRRGVMRGGSVGFDPLEAHIEIMGGEEVIVFGENALSEFSCAVVPSNPDALADVKQRVHALVTRSRDRSIRDPRGLRVLLEEDRDARARARVVVPANLVPAQDETRGAIPFEDTPAVEDAWDAGKAVGTLRKWASSDGSGDVETIDWKKFARGFAWVDPDKKAAIGGYKLPHHTVKDGKLVLVRAGLAAAAGAVNGSHGQKPAIPAADIEGVKRHLGKHYETIGLSDPWKEKAHKPAGASPDHHEGRKIMKRIPKDKIRTPVDGGAVLIACMACSEEHEIGITDLPVDPAIATAHARAIETSKNEIRVIEAEKKAAESRATTAEERSQSLLGDVGRMLVEIATRDIDAIVGKKINPSERDAELAVARVYIETGMTVVETRDDKGNITGTEYAGLVKWRERFKTLQARADLGLIGPSVQRGKADPSPPRGEVKSANPTAPAGAPSGPANANAGLPAVPPGATTGGHGFAKRIAALGKDADPQPVGPRT